MFALRRKMAYYHHQRDVLNKHPNYRRYLQHDHVVTFSSSINACFVISSYHRHSRYNNNKQDLRRFCYQFDNLFIVVVHPHRNHRVSGSNHCEWQILLVRRQQPSFLFERKKDKSSFNKVFFGSDNESLSNKWKICLQTRPPPCFIVDNNKLFFALSSRNSSEQRNYTKAPLLTTPTGGAIINCGLLKLLRLPLPLSLAEASINCAVTTVVVIVSVVFVVGAGSIKARAETPAWCGPKNEETEREDTLLDCIYIYLSTSWSRCV